MYTHEIGQNPKYITIYEIYGTRRKKCYTHESKEVNNGK